MIQNPEIATDHASCLCFSLNFSAVHHFLAHRMSSNVEITGSGGITAPTPQNTPLTQAPIALGLSRPTVPDISEDNEGEASAADESGEGMPSLAGLEHHMLGMVQGRLADLVGKSSGYIENLPVEVKLNVEALKGVQVKQNELQNQYKRECLELEKKVGPFLTFSPDLHRTTRSIDAPILLHTDNFLLSYAQNGLRSNGNCPSVASFVIVILIFTLLPYPNIY